MVILKSAQKGYTEDSFHKITPEETVKIAISKLRHFGQGAFFGLQDITSLNQLGLPAYRVVGKKRFNEWGKGLTSAQAQASALMERIERISSSVDHRDPIPTLFSSFNNLQGKAVSKISFWLSNIHHVLHGADKIDDIEMNWTEASSLVTGKIVLVPSQHVYLGVRYLHFSDQLDSNGLASGNTIEEAILQALGEVIERHVHHVVHYNRPEVRQIDLSTLKNERLKNLVLDLEKKGFNLLAHDVSLGLGLNSVSCFLFHPDEKIILGNYLKIGTSTHPEISLIRAITEAAQNWSVLRYRGIDREHPEGFHAGASESNREIFKWLSNNSKTISINDVPRIANNDFLVEIKTAVKILSDLGYNVLAYDLTHPRLGIPVVRVMVPGLQPNFLVRGLDCFHKDACVTPHLLVYDEVMEKVKRRALSNQQIDEIAVV